VATVSWARSSRQYATRHRGEQTRCGRRPVRGCPQTAQRRAAGGLRTSPDATLGSGLCGETLIEGRRRWRASAASTRALTHQAGRDAHRPHDRGSLCAVSHRDALAVADRLRAVPQSAALCHPPFSILLRDLVEPSKEIFRVASPNVSTTLD
jgi:hypothetical protein